MLAVERVAGDDDTNDDVGTRNITATKIMVAAKHLLHTMGGIHSLWKYHSVAPLCLSCSPVVPGGICGPCVEVVG